MTSDAKPPTPPRARMGISRLVFAGGLAHITVALLTLVVVAIAVFPPPPHGRVSRCQPSSQNVRSSSSSAGVTEFCKTPNRKIRVFQTDFYEEIGPQITISSRCTSAARPG